MLPESGMMDFRDAGRFVSQSGAATFDSGDAGKLPAAKTERISKNENES